jgi:hypothetical protein
MEAAELETSTRAAVAKNYDRVGAFERSLEFASSAARSTSRRMSSPRDLRRSDDVGRQESDDVAAGAVRDQAAR